MGVSRETTIDHTALAEVAGNYRQQAKDGQAPYLFMTLAIREKFGLGLALLDVPEAGGVEARLGHLMVFEAASRKSDLKLITWPEPLNTAADIERNLGGLAVSPELAAGLWRKLVKKAVKSAKDSDYNLNGWPGGLLNAAESKDVGWEIAWARRQQLIIQRAGAQETHTGNFGPIQVKRAGKKPYIWWERKWHNPITDRLEAHVMDKHHTWLLDDNPNIEYVIQEPVDIRNGRDYISVSPNPEDAAHSNEVHAEFEDYIAKVAAGECYYGRFNCIFNNDKTVRYANLILQQDDETHEYTIVSDQTNLFESTNQTRKHGYTQGCFFEVVKNRTTASGNQQHFCRIVGPPPIDTPKTFRGTVAYDLYQMAQQGQLEQIGGNYKYIFRKPRT